MIMKAPGATIIKPRRYALSGALLWISCVQYFIAQAITASAWPMEYSIRANVISDLGNTSCNPASVCSPLYAYMNASLALLGAAMLLGSFLLFYRYRPAGWAGFWCMGIAGAGVLLVAAFPENANLLLHYLGAAPAFVLGNVALILFGITLPMPRFLRSTALVFGVGALIGLALFVTGQDLGLGVGTMERIAAYPQTFWIISFGTYVLWAYMDKTSSHLVQ